MMEPVTSLGVNLRCSDIPYPGSQWAIFSSQDTDSTLDYDMVVY